MSVSDKIFFGGFVLFALVAGLCIGYAVADHRSRGVVDQLAAELNDARDRERAAVAAAADYRGQLDRAGELAGQLGDGLARAIETASRATSYRSGAQIYIDAIRNARAGLGDLARLGATENTELAPLDDY